MVETRDQVMQLLLSVLLFSVLQIQLASLERNAPTDCEKFNMSYVSFYDEAVSEGIKVLDALTAQSEFILNKNYVNKSIPNSIDSEIVTVD